MHNFTTFHHATSLANGFAARSPSFEMSMQFLSYYERNEYESSGGKPANLFLGTRDFDGHSKVFDMGPASLNDLNARESFPIELVVLPENHHGIYTYQMAFPFVIGVLRGDWYDACRYYRQWVTDPTAQAPWVRQGPMRNDDTFSTYIKNAKAYGYWGPTFCDTCDAATPPTPNAVDRSSWQYLLQRVNEQCSLLHIQDPTKTAIRINHWEQYSFGANVGEYLPIPFQFLTTAHQLRDSNYPFNVYFNTTVYSNASPNPFSDMSVPVLTCGAQSGSNHYDLERESVYTEDQLPMVEDDVPPLNRRSSNPCETACLPLTERFDLYTLDQRSSFILDYLRFYANTLAPHGNVGFYLDSHINNIPIASYNPDPTYLHPHGGGNSWTQGKLKTLADLKASVCDQHFYIDAEGNQEMSIGFSPPTPQPPFALCEISYDRQKPAPARVSYWDGQELADDGYDFQFYTPMFQAVYHEYHITCGSRQITFDIDPAVLNDFANSRIERQELAAALHYGCLPGFGGPATAESIDLRVNQTLYPATYLRFYADWINMYATFMDLLTEDGVRSFTVFGDRVRDPKCEDRLGFETVLNPPSPPPEDLKLYLPDGRDEATQSLGRHPYVYVGAYSLVEVGQTRPSLGVLMLNWTYPYDDGNEPGVTIPPGIPPYPNAGTQTLTISIDPTEYGLTGHYKLVRIMSNGGEQLLQADIDLGGPFSRPTAVLPASGRFWVFRPI